MKLLLIFILSMAAGFIIGTVVHPFSLALILSILAGAVIGMALS